MAATNRTNYLLLFWITPLLLGLATAWFFSSLVGSGLLTQSAGVGAAPSGLPVQGKAGISRDRDIVFERNVLGLALPPKPRKKVKVTGPRPSAWTVIGISTGARSLAVISVKGTAKTLLVGDSEQGWTLREIRRSSIVWEKEGATEEVSLWTGEEDALGAIAKKTNPLDGVKSARVTVSRSEAAYLLNDPAALMQEALYKPFIMHGKVAGFTLTNIAKDSLFRKIGLIDGDVLMRVNGEAMDDPAKLIRAYSALAKASTVSIDLKRQFVDKSLLVILE